MTTLHKNADWQAPSRGPLPVSVVIPTFDRIDRVCAAIASVLGGTRLPAQLIVVDDASNDGTVDTLNERFAGTLIEVHEHERNRGVAAARNTGISVCNHELVALLDSDDVWLPNHLETLWEAMSASNAKVVQSRERWFRKGRRVNPKQYHLPPQGDIFEPSLARCLVSSSAVLFEKALFEAVGRYDPRLPACEDYDLWLRMALVADFGLADQETIEKDGGRSDQLSLRYWGMDRFRVFALVKLLDEALTDGQAELVEETALGKLEVLHAGAAKRGKVEDAEGYARWVDAIRRRDRTARGCSDRQTMSLPGALENAGFDWVRRADDPILSALREAE